MKKICGVCGNEINWKNRWEIINHYSEDTLYGIQGVIKTTYTFCSERCMVRWIGRNIKGFEIKLFNPKLITKTYYRRKK